MKIVTTTYCMNKTSNSLKKPTFNQIFFVLPISLNYPNFIIRKLNVIAFQQHLKLGVSHNS